MNTNEEYHRRHREMVANMEPFNVFDPEVEAAAAIIWNEFFREKFLIEWADMARPFIGNPVGTAERVLKTAETIVALRRLS